METKRKPHTLKTLAITNQIGEILFVSNSYEGSVHDKKIWDDIAFDFRDLNILADLGFVGADKEYSNIILPYKKAKNKDITELQKVINKGIGAVRVKVEHAFNGVKRLKIARNKIRLKT